MLAAAIFARPDVLLLDEPTNHLSIRAVLWLARELATNPVWKVREKEGRRQIWDLRLPHSPPKINDPPTTMSSSFRNASS
jgi:hypothetical protein